MLRVVNKTPFTTHLFGAMDLERRDTLVVVVKGTFTFERGGATKIADEQVGATLGDVSAGEAGKSSVLYESDCAPEKSSTDVILNGCAYAARGASEATVSIEAGRMTKVARVVGERRWVRDAGGRYRPTAAARFEKIDLVWENAYGGTDASVPPPSPQATSPADQRNPVGRGFLANGTRASLDAMPLPLIEDPRWPVQAPTDQPPPTSFGFVHRSWWPRAGYAGTYDEKWKADAAPFLPADFDRRFHQSASPGLTSIEPFRGGEYVRVQGVRPGGMGLEFRVPMHTIEVSTRTLGADRAHPSMLDTITIEPELERVTCVWRAVVSCPRKMLSIERVQVAERRA